jgi:hypothetical protein
VSIGRGEVEVEAKEWKRKQEERSERYVGDKEKKYKNE